MLDVGIRVTYRMVVPVLVVLGAVGSIVSICVLRQPALKKAKVNRYFLMMALYDLGLSFFYIPVAVTALGCTFPSYGFARYYTHFGWTTIGTLHALATYVIVFLALDRFVGVWFPTWFKRLQQPPFNFPYRTATASVLLVAVHVPYAIDGAVECWRKDEETWFKVHVNQSNIRECPNGNWVSIDGFEYSFEKEWHAAYRYFYNFLVRWFPYALLLIFNVSLVTAVKIGRLRFPGAAARQEQAYTGAEAETFRERRRKRQRMSSSERVLIVTVIAMTASYVLFTLPITVFLTGFADTDTERCVTPSTGETVRHVGNTLQLLEHVLHVVFLLLINPRFRRQAACLVQCNAPSMWESETATPDDQQHSRRRSLSPSLTVSQSTRPSTPHLLQAGLPPKAYNRHSPLTSRHAGNPIRNSHRLVDSATPPPSNTAAAGTALHSTLRTPEIKNSINKEFLGKNATEA